MAAGVGPGDVYPGALRVVFLLWNNAGEDNEDEVRRGELQLPGAHGAGAMHREHWGGEDHPARRWGPTGHKPERTAVQVCNLRVRRPMLHGVCKRSDSIHQLPSTGSGKVLQDDSCDAHRKGHPAADVHTAGVLLRVHADHGCHPLQHCKSIGGGNAARHVRKERRPGAYFGVPVTSVRRNWRTLRRAHLQQPRHHVLRAHVVPKCLVGSNAGSRVRSRRIKLRGHFVHSTPSRGDQGPARVQFLCSYRPSVRLLHPSKLLGSDLYGSHDHSQVFHNLCVHHLLQPHPEQHPVARHIHRVWLHHMGISTTCSEQDAAAAAAAAATAREF
mmetsp:Transcript_9391/g.28314  ORF Transcript_9391/g.28314 Transcript_9391/m.28314 type:complete len:329 (+) Transcript_9391:170-1156(+)